MDGRARRQRRSALGLGLSLAFLLLTGFRPDDPDSTGLFRFEPGHEVEFFDGEGGRVRVHFTRTGPDAVRLADADQDGVPDSVETVAAAYEEVLAFFAAQGFREAVSDLGNPLGDGGSDRLDVYLVDFGGQADGAFVRERCEVARPICSGYIVQENDFAGYGYPSFAAASRILASHELFHAIQAAYDAEQGANWSEATATWASEFFDPSLTDFEYLIRGWFERPDRSIDQEPIGPVDRFSYGLAIFARYLSERFGDDIHRRHWEDLVDGARGVADPRWLPALVTLLERDHETAFDEAWVEFAEWVIRAGQGRVTDSFANAHDYPRVARELVQLPFADERLRAFRASMQVWSASPAGRGEISAALASEEASALEDLTLILAARRGPEVTSTQGMELRPGVVGAQISAAGADEVIVVVVNAATSGQSRRPGLCFGSPDEVSACVAARAPLDPGEPTEPGPEAEETTPSVEVAEIAEPDDADTSGGDDLAEATITERGDASGCHQSPDAGLVSLVLGILALLGRHGRRLASTL